MAKKGKPIEVKMNHDTPLYGRMGLKNPTDRIKSSGIKRASVKKSSK